MALRLIYDIRITTSSNKVLVFDYVNDVEVVSSFNMLTSTAKITLPRNYQVTNGVELKSLISPGNKVSIQCGYNTTLNTEFIGVISRIDPSVPFVIYCEDYMWYLKQVTISKSYSSVTLKKLMNEIVPKSIKTVVVDVDLGSFRINSATVSSVLDYIKQQYGIISYFRGETLYAALGGWSFDKYKKSAAKEVTVHFQKNMISESLEFRTKLDAKVKVHASSVHADGTVIKYSVGDEGGDTRSLHLPNNLPLETVKNMAKESIDKFKIDGYSGSFTTFGEPFFEHGYAVNLINDLWPERNGRYRIDKTIMRSGTNGYRRIGEISNKI